MPTKPNRFKVAFVDVRSSLGDGAGPGDFAPYRPQTLQLLECLAGLGVRTGAIVTLEAGTTHDDTAKGVRDAVLAQDVQTRQTLTIGKFIAASDIISDAQAGKGQSDPALYAYAAGKLEAAPEECLFISPILNFRIAAESAGMRTFDKLSPPGTDFVPDLVGQIGTSAVDSGWQFQAILEHEHELGERIFGGGERIADEIEHLLGDFQQRLEKKMQQTPPLKKWDKLPPISVSDSLREAMECYVFLLDHFADQVHLRAEEHMLDVAVARGMPPEYGDWVYDQHEQARKYWSGLDTAWRRIKQGDNDDRWFALLDFQVLSRGFVFLFKAHAIREDYETYTEAGRRFNASDDALVVNLITHTGPSDISPYVGMVERMEALLGIKS
jgi:hypothetical protein